MLRITQPIGEIRARARITDVWSALGGGKLRGRRGQAFWRNGDGYSVSVDSTRGLWHDFVTGDGGDIFTLVQTVRGCDFREALEWLADFAGIDLGTPSRGDNRADTDWATDLRRATWWARSAAALAEWALEKLPSSHPERRGLTLLLQVIRMADAVLVSTYRESRRQHPELTQALVRAGQHSDARKQRLLSRWIANYAETTA
jgi:hypothetical protein